MTAAAMQARLDLVALEAGVACFGARAPTHAVALLDVVGAEAALGPVPTMPPRRNCWPAAPSS